MTDRDVRLFLLDYEIRGAGWPHYVSWSPMQSLVAWYFSCKVARKYRRWQHSLAEERRVADLKGERRG